MKKTFSFLPLCLLISAFALFIGCNNANKPKHSKGIAGTWRLVEFADFDSTANVWIYPFGKNPKGYFTYTPSGVISINISNENPLKISSEEGKKHSVNVYEYTQKNSLGYFGTYTLEAEKGRVIHHVKGGTIPWYTDTDQPRLIQLKGDTAIIGDNKTARRVLVRVD